MGNISLEKKTKGMFNEQVRLNNALVPFTRESFEKHCSFVTHFELNHEHL